MDKYLADFHEQANWILSLITDPIGSRHFHEESLQTKTMKHTSRISRISRFLEFLGNPQHQFKSVHVAGTSGKGSVVVMIANMLTQHRLRTGFHVTPYLQICNEKLIIDNTMIAPYVFAKLVKEFRTLFEKWVAKGNELRYGEVWVALTYLWFAKEKIDWGIIETGVGGRFDATNVLPSKLAVITEIGYDHIKHLGPTLADIAYHKAGIIKENSVAVTSVTNNDILSIIKKEATEKHAELYTIGNDFNLTVKKIDQHGAVISVDTPFHHYNNIFISLQGHFQPTNAAIAIMAYDLLAEKYNITRSEKSIRTALKNITFPGRMEVMQYHPLVMLDGAHNKQKMQALVESIQIIYPSKKMTVIIGVLATKDATSLINILAPLTCRFIATRPYVFGKKSLEPIQLTDIIKNISPNKEVHVTDDVQKSVELVLRMVNDDELILVTGSLYLVGEARDYWIPKDNILNCLNVQEKLRVQP